MNQRLVSVFVFAVVVAGMASFLVYRLVASHVQTQAPAVETTVVVADRDLEVGTLIQNSDLRIAPWRGPVPEQTVTKPEEVVGRGVVTRIFKGEPLSAGRLAAKGAGAGLAATIPLGMRAVALRVNDVVGLAGFVLPGMRVDVLVVGNMPGADSNRTGTISRTVLQNLEVLSANQRIARNADGKPEDAQVVNLLVTPDQAEILNLAGSEGKVQLVLRNPLDTREQVTHGSTSSTLFGGAAVPLPRASGVVGVSRASRAPAPLVAKAVKPEIFSVEVFSGVKRTEQKFGAPAEER